MVIFFIRKNMLISIQINHSHLGVVNYKALMDFSSVLDLSDRDSDCIHTALLKAKYFTVVV